MGPTEEGLQKELDKITTGKWTGLGVEDVEPTNEPGLFVIKRVCRCGVVGPPEEALALCVFGVVGTAGPSRSHYHYLRLDEELWREVSEQRGWSQRSYCLSFPDPEAK